MVSYLKKEAEGVSYLTLEYAKAQVKGFNEAGLKRVTAYLSSL